MKNCPSLNSLVEFLNDRMTPQERKHVEAHLATGCRRCEEERVWLAEILELTSSDLSFEFPEHIIGRVIDQFKSTRPAKPSLIERLQGHLVFDSFQMQPLMGLRDSLTAEQTPSERQVLYNADGYDVDLRFEVIEASDAGVFENVIGQILSQESPGAGTIFRVSLLQGTREVASADTNEQGIFRFTRILSGVYAMKVVVPEGEVYIDEVATARLT
jgi:hypothetical protein